MKIGEAFPSRWLKAADLQGKKVNVTIESVGFENIGDDGDKLVAYLKNSKKGLVLNVTNANMITEICGTDETDDWTGKRICLFPTRVDFQGRRVDAIRVDFPTNDNGRQQPEPKPAPAAVLGDDDIPF